MEENHSTTRENGFSGEAHEAQMNGLLKRLVDRANRPELGWASAGCPKGTGTATHRNYCNIYGRLGTAPLIDSEIIRCMKPLLIKKTAGL